MSTILDNIVAHKLKEVAQAKRDRPAARLQSELDRVAPPRDFFKELASGDSIKLIAEVKKASPSKGIIRSDFDPVHIAQTYEANGAACLSVLTDETFFQGNLDYLSEIKQSVGLPVLRKDFILDPYQVLEARAAGADAVLLIAECLDDCSLRSLHNAVVDFGMAPLVEFYQPENLPRVLAAGATLIGVNNRDLRSFETDLQHTIRMREQLPPDCVLVGESGIHSRADAQLLEAAGVDAMLVGEHLMASNDIGAAVRNLLGH